MKIFIAGPRAVSKLNKSVENRLFNIYNNNFTVFVNKPCQALNLLTY